MSETLTQNGILFIGAGFTDDIVLQLIAFKKSKKFKGFDLVVSDGKVYAGAIYRGHEKTPFYKYCLLKVKARMVEPNEPMYKSLNYFRLIDQLEILNQRVDKYIGRQC